MLLDIGCGPKKLPEYTGMDIRLCAGVDIIGDIEDAWPIESGTCQKIHASHIMEHVKPWKVFDVFNEAWRVLEDGGEMTVHTPYGVAYAFDPTHCILFQESSFNYLTPLSPLYQIYTPKPWDILSCERNEPLQEMTTILRKRPL
jgi:hypothetical protein